MTGGPPRRENPLWHGPALALASAALFGASTPLAKLLLGRIEPWLLAGLFYAGSGVGLAFYLALRRHAGPKGRPQPFASRDALWLGLAVLLGGVAGPVLLMIGLARTPASSTALLLNLEGVFSALIAWFVFRENFDWRIAVGMVLVLAGGALLAWPQTLSFAGLAGPLAIAAACLAWALDNNFTRKVALRDPVAVAMIKGLAAGSVNVALAFAQGAVWPGWGVVLAAGVVGLVGYGISLTLFVAALARLGAARTSAYYSAAPLFGAGLAIALLAEPLTPNLGAAAILMAAGIGLHLAERHIHTHRHAALVHVHRHAHDSHHEHAHGPDEPLGEPHAHRHVHRPMIHRHPHYPDEHHRHEH